MAAEGALYTSLALFYPMSYSQSLRYRNSRIGFQVDIPRTIYSPPLENDDGMLFGKDPLFSIGCYRGLSIRDAYNISVQPQINQGIPMLINEWANLRGSSIIHSKYTNPGALLEIYIIPGKRGAYGIVLSHSFSNLPGELSGRHVLYSRHLRSLLDSFEEIDVARISGYGGVSYGGYGEREMGWGTEQMLKFGAETGINPYE